MGGITYFNGLDQVQTLMEKFCVSQSTIKGSQTHFLNNSGYKKQTLLYPIKLAAFKD
jgi:hypothetical protein